MDWNEFPTLTPPYEEVASEQAGQEILSRSVALYRMCQDFCVICEKLTRDKISYSNDYF